MTNKISWIALLASVVALVIACVSLYTPHNGKIFGGTTNYDTLASTGLQVGANCNNGFATCSGTLESGFNFGTCYVQASSITIAASSTATVDCQAGTTGTQSALTGVSTNDNVSVQFSTTTPTTFQGLTVLGASASSTAGYITMKVYNGTGTTFTWIASASTTQYHVYR